MPGPPPPPLPAVTVTVALAALLALTGSTAAVSATAVTVKLPAVPARAVNTTVRASFVASNNGSQEMLLALAAQARPPASIEFTASPVGTSIDRRASEVTLGPRFVMVTEKRASAPTARLEGVALTVVEVSERCGDEFD